MTGVQTCALPIFIGLWHVFMSEQVLVRVFRFVAIPQEKFEEMKQAQEVEFANGTLEKNA